MKFSRKGEETDQIRDIFHISSIEKKGNCMFFIYCRVRAELKAENDLAWPDAPVKNFFKIKNINWKLVSRKNILRIF